MFSLGIAVSIACLAAILIRLDLQQIGAAFAAADYRALPILIACIGGVFWLNSRRWTWFLRPLGDFSTRETFSPLVVGFAMNNLLPARLGELVRVHIFCRKHKTSPVAILSGIALERVFDVIAIIVLLVIGLSGMPDVDPRIRQTGWLLAAAAGAAIGMAVAYVVWTRPATRLLDAILSRTPFVSDALRERLLDWLSHGADGLGVLRNRRLVARSLLNTLLQWSLAGLQMSIALWSFGVEIPPAAACLLVAVVALGITVPSAPGYLGVIQALFLLVVNEQTLGVTNESAVFGASVYYHMTQYALVTCSGLFLLHREGLSLAQAQSVEEASDLIESTGALSDDGAPEDAFVERRAA